MKAIKGPKEKSRQAKRSMKVTVTIDGVEKVMTAVKYCDYAARLCPVMHVTATDAKIDHNSAIRKMYMQHGLKGVDTYIDRINQVIDAKNRIKMKAVRKIRRTTIIRLTWQATKNYVRRFWVFLGSWRKHSPVS